MSAPDRPARPAWLEHAERPAPRSPLDPGSGGEYPTSLRPVEHYRHALEQYRPAEDVEPGRTLWRQDPAAVLMLVWFLACVAAAAVLLALHGADMVDELRNVARGVAYVLEALGLARIH